MDKTALVADDIVQARRFVDALRGAGLPVALAMWLKKPASDRWVLAVASPDVQAHGPAPVIRLGEAVRRAQGGPSIAREDVYFFNTAAGFLEDIARFPARVAGESAVVESFTFNGADVERAVVLWVDRSASPSRRASPLGPERAAHREAS